MFDGISHRSNVRMHQSARHRFAPPGRVRLTERTRRRAKPRPRQVLGLCGRTPRGGDEIASFHMWLHHRLQEIHATDLACLNEIEKSRQASHDAN
jgi:hypothetical protein